MDAALRPSSIHPLEIVDRIELHGALNFNARIVEAGHSYGQLLIWGNDGTPKEAADGGAGALAITTGAEVFAFSFSVFFSVFCASKVCTRFCSA